MRIKKISPTTPANGNIENQYGTSQTNAYSEEYVNGQIGSLSNLTTTAKTNIVSAINEVNALKGTILWQNSSPNSNMADGTEINLSSSDYDVLEIYYKYTTNNDNMWSKKIIKGYNAYLDIATPYYTTANFVANEYRTFTRQSNTKYVVSKCNVCYQDNTNISREDMIIPLYIVGYKTGLF